MSDGHEITAALYAYRDKYGLTQAQLAELMRLSVRTVQCWEQGRRCSLGRQILALLTLDPSALEAIFRKSERKAR